MRSKYLTQFPKKQISDTFLQTTQQ
jgi:hypothetical protein